MAIFVRCFATFALFAAATLGVRSANAGYLIDFVEATAVTNHYEGPCPGALQLMGTIGFGLTDGRKTRAFYRWEASDGTIGDEYPITLSHRRESVVVNWPIASSIPESAPLSIRFHLYGAMKDGKTLANDYSTP